MLSLKRKLLYTLGSLVGVVVIIVVAVVSFLASEAGSRWLVHYEAGSISNSITIKQVQGNALSGLVLHGIEYRDNWNQVSIEHVELSLRILSLLRGNLHLRKVYVGGITYDSYVNEEPVANVSIQPLQSPFLPPRVILEDGRLERIVFRRGDSRYELDHLFLVAQIDKNGLNIRRAEAAGRDFSVKLAGRSKLFFPYPFQANLNWNARLPNGVKARGKCSISGDVNSIELNHTLLKPFSIANRGKVEVSGSLTDSFRWVFIGDLNGQGLPPTRIQALGKGNLTGLQIEKIVAHSLGGEVTVNGHIVLQPHPLWEFTVSGKNLDPGKQWPQWPGNLSLDTKVRGEIKAGIPTVMLERIQLFGLMFKQPFQTAGNLTFRGKELSIEDLKIGLGKNQLTFGGSAAGDLDLRFDLEAADPNIIWPGVEGHLSANGFLRGTLRNPISEITLKGHNMHYGAYSLQELEGQLVIDSNETNRSNGQFRLQNLHVADEEVSNLSVNWAGNFKQHRVQVEFNSTTAKVELKFEGGYHQSGGEFKVGTASFGLEKYGRWQLVEPVILNLGYGEIKPFKACWIQENSNTCVRGSWNDASGWKMEAELSSPPLILMRNLLKKVFKKGNLGWQERER